MPKRKESGLTDSQRAFAREYVRNGGNASKAWSSVTGKGKNADVNGPMWLGKVGIQAEIKRIRAENERSSLITRERSLAILSEIAEGDTEAAHERIAALKLAGSWCGWEKGTEADQAQAKSLESLAAAVLAARKKS